MGDGKPRTGLQVTISFLIVAALGPGCAQECPGTDPSCDVAWPGARLTVVAPLQSTVVETTDAGAAVAIVSGRVDDGVDHGTDWSADTVGDTIVVGVPDANGVFVTEAVTGDLGLAPVLRGAGRFGSIVRVAEGANGISLFVGAPLADVGRGAIVRFPDDGGPLENREPDLSIVGETPNDRIGERFIVCPDIDEDGIPELVVGSPGFEVGTTCGDADPAPPSLAGAVFVVRSEVLASRSGEVSICEVADVLWGTELAEQAGTSLACDGEAVYVGAPYFGLEGDPTPNAGRVVRVPWSVLPDNAEARAGVALPSVGTVRVGPAAEATFGQALATLSVDGAPHLLVGAPGESGRRGRIALITADPGLTTERASVLGSVGNEQFGRVVVAGDLDQDGIDDVAVGSPDVVIGPDLDVGQLWLWRGTAVAQWSGAVDQASVDQIIVGTHPFQRVGRKASRTTLQGRPVLLIPTRAAPAPR